LEFVDGYISQEIDILSSSSKVKIYKGDYYTVIYFTREILQQLCCFFIIASLLTWCRIRFPDYFPLELCYTNNIIKT
jgi:hypothetical protein